MSPKFESEPVHFSDIPKNIVKMPLNVLPEQGSFDIPRECVVCSFNFTIDHWDIKYTDPYNVNVIDGKTYPLFATMQMPICKRCRNESRSYKIIKENIWCELFMFLVSLIFPIGGIISGGYWSPEIFTPIGMTIGIIITVLPFVFLIPFIIHAKKRPKIRKEFVIQKNFGIGILSENDDTQFIWGTNILYMERWAKLLSVKLQDYNEIVDIPDVD